MTSVPRIALSGGGVRRLAAATALCVATLAIAVGPALAAAPTVFRNIPTVLPGNVPSQPFEAQEVTEFGDLIQLEAGERSTSNLPVTVVMSSQGCENGAALPCTTTPGATWNQELTLKLYSVKDVGGTPATDSVLLTKTHTFAIPYRPSYDPSGPCAKVGSTGWYSAAETTDAAHPVCRSGVTYPAVFDLSDLPGVNLPDQLIWGISFNTADYGTPPTHVNGPWNSLNVGVFTFPNEPSVGMDVDSTSAFINTGAARYYSDGGAGGTGTFRDDVGGWIGYAPLVCFGYCPINLAAAPTPTPPPPATPTPTVAPTVVPTGSAAASATPVEQVGGVTAAPVSATLPPTSSSNPSDGGSSGLLLLLISLGFGSVGLLAVRAQRRTVRQ